MNKLKKKLIDQNFIEIIQIFNRNKINYWVCHGTLLGIIRDNNLIKWDHDIDIALWKKENKKKNIIKLLEKNSFVLRKNSEVKNNLISFEKKGGRIIDINFYQLRKKKNKIAFVKWFIPRNNLMKFIDAISKANEYNGKFKYIIKIFALFQKKFEIIKKLLIKKNLFFKISGYFEPYEYIGDIKKINFNGLKVRIPEFPEKYLRFLYGNDWKTPKKNYKWYEDTESLINK